MGVVYRAQHVETKRPVALKTVKLTKTRDLASIRSEIRALSRLRHPGVVRIENEGIENGLPWYAMELLEGQTLAGFITLLWGGRRGLPADRTETVTTDGGVEPTVEGAETMHNPAVRASEPLQAAAGGRLTDALGVMGRLCFPLAYIHSRAIVHGDLKPSNIFIRSDGTPVLVDFGLVARFRGAIGREALESAGQLRGTMAYVAPEQIRGEFVDARADIYTLGVMLYEVLTGRLPFRAHLLQDLAAQHLSETPAPPSHLVSDIPEALDDLVLRLLAKRPQDRIGHAEDVAKALVALGAMSDTASVPSVRGGTPYLFRPAIAGRKDVLEDLTLRLDDIRAGRGSLVLVGGESGIGKTLVANEIARRAIRSRVQVITCECLPMIVAQTTGSPLHPLRPFLQAVSDLCLEGGSEVTERVLGARGKLLSAYLPALDQLPTEESHPAPAALSGQAAIQRLMSTLRDTFVAVARETPLLLIIDDLQWADELTLTFLSTLPKDFFEGERVCILATYRTEDVSDGLREVLNNTSARLVHLGRLDERTIETIVRDMLSMPKPPPGLVSAIARQSEGNPFLVAECLRVAVAERILQREGSQWRLATEPSAEPHDALPIPKSVQGLVTRRFSVLGEAAQRLAETGAVLGRECERDVLARAADLEEGELGELVNELVERAIFEVLPSAHVRFVHDKVRETIYTLIPHDRKRSLHLRVAQAIEDRYRASDMLPQRYSHLAHHFKQGGDPSRAVDYFEKAGELALRSFAHQDAASSFNQVLSLGESLPRPLDGVRLAKVERALVDAHLGLGNSVLGRKHAANALRHYGEAALPISVANQATRVTGQILLRVIQAYAPSWFKIESAEQEAQSLGVAYILNRLLEPAFMNNEPLLGTYCGIRNILLAERLPPSVSLARGYAFMSIILGLTPLKSIAHRWSSRALEISQALGSEETMVYCLNRTSCFLLGTGACDQAEQRLVRAIELSRQIGDPRQLEESVSIRAVLLHALGRFDEGLEAGREVLGYGVARGDAQIEGWGRNFILQNLTRLGRHQNAIETEDLTLQWISATAEETERIWARSSLALAHLHNGDPQKARRHADQALRLLEKQAPVQYYLMTPLSQLCEVYAALLDSTADGTDRGTLRRAAASASRILEKFSEMIPYGKPAAHLWKGVFAKSLGRHSRARRHLAGALSGAQKLGMPYFEGRARIELATLTDGDDRKVHLKRARELMILCAAQPELGRIDNLLTGQPLFA
jgi:serine/threonine protein kinase/tetratricopeptide (TPR) repeat protein